MKERDSSLVGASMLLLIAFGALEVVLRYAMEYDLVRGHVPLKSYDGAPIYPFIAAIVLIAGAVGGITFLVALAMIARARASARGVALALIPAALLLGFQYVLAAVDEYERNAPARRAARSSVVAVKEAAKDLAGQQQEDAGAAWAARTHLLRMSGCKELGQSDRFVRGCQGFVFRQVGSDPYTLGEAGAAWAVIHHIKSENDCRSSTLPDYEEDLFFLASCKRQVWDEQRHRGEAWARSHNLRAAEDCDAKAGEPALHPEFLVGCRAGIAAIRVESVTAAR